MQTNAQPNAPSAADGLAKLIDPAIPNALTDCARVDAKAFMAVLGCSRTWFYDELKAKRLPEPIRQGKQYTRWTVRQVREHCERQTAQQR